jgi:hypothetical protein
VTTRRRNLWLLNILGRGLGPLAARALSVRMLGLGIVVLAMLGLPPRRLPAVDLPLALWLLTEALMATPRLVFAPAPFAQAVPLTQAAPSGLGAVPSFNVVDAHGRFDLPREKLGEDVSASSSGAIKSRTRLLITSLKRSDGTRQRTRRH